MSDVLLIWGAGEHAKVVLDVARSTRLFQRIAFIDDDLSRAGQRFCGCRLTGGSEELHRFAGGAIVIAIGTNRTRAFCYDRARANGLRPTVLVHRKAIISRSARIGSGTVVMPGAVVNAGAVIAENCIINTGAIVEHDCQIADHVHISPRAVLGGGVRAGLRAHVGIGAVILPGATLGEDCVVGAGAVVLREAPAGCTVVGIPARARSHVATV